MNFNIEKLPHEPIVICTMAATFDPANEYPAFWAQLGKAVQGLEGPIYRIPLVLDLDFNFGRMAVAIAEEARSGKPGSLGDPRIRNLLVSQAALAQLSIESLQQEQYGRLDNTLLFSTVEEALAYARQQFVLQT
jgi:hypothetical protein